MEKFIVHPEKDHDSVLYWEYLKEHKARLQKCENCGRFRFPPYPRCHYCGTSGGEWTLISGQGTVYSWVVVWHPIDPRLAAEVPFVVALVKLEEGPRVAGRLICDPEQIKGGMPVKTRYDDVDAELVLLNFEPAR
jgi:uncharacterized OB-fold protein